MKNLIVIRHGESEANQAGIYQGQTYDTPLTHTGRIQAQAVATALDYLDREEAQLIASPLKRAFQTAQMIARQLQLPIHQEPLVQEINHGTWEGKTVSQFSPDEKIALHLWKNDPEKAQMPGGETLADVFNRCRQFLAALPRDQETTIVVTHDVIIRLFVIMALDLPLHHIWKVSLENSGITKFSLHPFTLLSLNETYHLRGLRSSLAAQAL